MARILVLTHAFDKFYRTDEATGKVTCNYMILDILTELQRRGHSYAISTGLDDLPTADLAILHVDSTVVPHSYREAAGRYRICLNRHAVDISKRLVSGAVLNRGERWDGQVIVKSNLNHRGRPEAMQNIAAKEAGRALPHPDLDRSTEYKVYPSVSAVPEETWLGEELVVERFIPEPDADGFALRVWVFCGDSERCTRHVSKDPMVKGARTIRREPVPVPPELRAERLRLGFDYGKFDFAVHHGRAILFDANKTPGDAPQLAEHISAGTSHLADGLERMLTKPPRRRLFNWNLHLPGRLAKWPSGVFSVAG
jgi:hypothetical protein